jgi:hypothetical protein
MVAAWRRADRLITLVTTDHPDGRHRDLDPALADRGHPGDRRRSGWPSACGTDLRRRRHRPRVTGTHEPVAILTTITNMAMTATCPDQ